MNSTTERTGRAHRRRSSYKAVMIALLAGTSMLLVSVGAGTANAAPTNVDLGAADSFSVLAGEEVTNTGPTTLSGDVGVSPGTSITGASDLTVGGTTHKTDKAASKAQLALTTAYNAAEAQGSTATHNALGGLTLTPGVYTADSSMDLTGTLTLDAENDPDAVFIFQASSDLITESSSKVILKNDAQACHVYWQVTSSATLGTNSKFVGTIMALTSITVETGATVAGRALARNGTVTLDSNTFTSAVCSAAPTTTATTTGTATGTATTTATTAGTATTTGTATGTAASGVSPPTTTIPGLAVTGPRHLTGLVGTGGALVAIGLIFLWTVRIRRRASH